MDAWGRAIDVGMTWNRMVARGLAGWLRTGAAVAEFNISVARDSLLAGLRAQERLFPLSSQATDAVESSLDEAMAALETSTADSTRAVAADVLSGADSAEAATTLQRNVQYAVAIQLLGIEPDHDGKAEPVRIEIAQE